jgi:hypothetical protein
VSLSDCIILSDDTSLLIVATTYGGIAGKAKFLFGDVGQVGRSQQQQQAATIIDGLRVTEYTVYVILPFQGTNVKLVVNMIMGTMMGK